MTTHVVYKIILHRSGHEDEIIYWSGSRQETINLARKAALKGNIELLSIIEFSSSGVEVFSQRAPFRQNNGSDF